MISVIIPIYNAEQWIQKTLDCIKRQTFSDLEILLIDDGSTDQSGQICDNFANSDSKVHCFHQKNMGVSAARNLGIKKATGEYITFLDADDEIEENYFEELFISIGQADVAVCDVVCKDRKGKEVSRFSMKKQILEQTDAVNLLLTRKNINSGPCAKLFKKDLIKNIAFQPLKAYEDILFVLEAFSNSTHIAVTDRTAYYYYQNDTGAMKKFFREPTTDIIVAADKIIQYIDTHENLSSECLYITLSHVYQYVVTINPKNKAESRFISEARRLFRRNYMKLLRCGSFSWKEKLLYGAFAIGYLYRRENE